MRKDVPKESNDVEQRLATLERQLRNLQLSSDRIASTTYETVDDFLHRSEKRVDRQADEFKQNTLRNWVVAGVILSLLSGAGYFVLRAIAQTELLKVEHGFAESVGKIENENLKLQLSISGFGQVQVSNTEDINACLLYTSPSPRD